MSTQPSSPPAPAPPAGPSTPTPVRQRPPWLLYGCAGFLALLLVIGATVAITLWYIQRPIRPVVLSAPEKAVVDEKLRHLGGGEVAATAPAAASLRGAEPA